MLHTVSCRSCIDTPMRVTVQQVGDTISGILSNMRIVIGACEVDLQKQTFKNEYRTNEEQKEPYLTLDEIKRMRMEFEKTLDSYYTLMKSLDRFCECNAGIESVKIKRELQKRHCIHCRGRKGKCGCKLGCKRSDKLGCIPNHCLHCSGVDGMCKCVHGCERVVGLQCRERSTFKTSKKAAKMEAEEEKDEEEEEEEEEESKEGEEEEGEDEDAENAIDIDEYVEKLVKIIENESEMPKLEKDKSKEQDKSSKKEKSKEVAKEKSKDVEKSKEKSKEKEKTKDKSSKK